MSSGLYVLASQYPVCLGVNRVVALFASGERCCAFIRLGLLYDSLAGVGYINKIACMWGIPHRGEIWFCGTCFDYKISGLYTNEKM